MRFITSLLISAAIPLAYALPCDPYGTVNTECKFVTFDADGATSNHLNFPTEIVGSPAPSEGERSLLPPFENINSCTDDATVVAFVSAVSNVMEIRIANSACVRPIATAMTKIYAADLVSHFTTGWGGTPDHPCLARYDWVTGESTCIQPCSDEVGYVCYIGVNANLTLLESPTTDEQDCNADATLPTALSVPTSPFLQSLAFSTSPANQLDLTVRAAHYKSRVPPTISIGSSCSPKSGQEWSPIPTVKHSGKCADDWSASYEWQDMYTSSCYSATSSATRGGQPYQKYEYLVTIVEQDELYIRPDDDENFATFRTTTTTQSFALYAKETADDEIVFDAFDYSNVVSIVTSASMSVDAGNGKLVVKVYNSVQDPFIFQAPSSMSLAKSGSENWGVVFDAQAGSEDNGGDTDLLLQFTLTTSAAGCLLDDGSFHFNLQVECNGATDPSECPIPGDGFENLLVTINVPEVDLCAESSTTDLTAVLHVFGSASYENRQAFFTEGRDPADYVYVAAVLSSSQVDIENCAVSVASAAFDGAPSTSKNLLDTVTNAAADWEVVYEDKIADFPAGIAVAGDCVALYRFTPAQALFPVAYDSSRVMKLTMTISTDMATKRSLSGATAEAAITLTNPADSDDEDASSDASSVTASMAMLVGVAAALLF